MKGRKNRASGGINQAKEDLASKPSRRDNATKIEDEASERKSGGRAGRKAGGMVMGAAPAANAGRAARKSGGRASCEASPFTSAHKGTSPKGHKADGDA